MCAPPAQNYPIYIVCVHERFQPPLEECLKNLKSSPPHVSVFAQCSWAHFISVYFRRPLFDKDEAQEWIDLSMKEKKSFLSNSLDLSL